MSYSSRFRTTREAAKAVGVSLVTLQRWIAAGKVKAPKLCIQGWRAVRLWGQSDLAGLRKVKQAIYCRGRGRKAKGKR